MALASDLAAAFSLIQQQQALEQRKEEGHQSMALNLLSMQMREAESTKSVLLKEYYDKKAEVRQSEDMFNQYDGLKPSDVSQGGRDLISIVDEQNKISVDAIVQNLDALNTYQSGLESSLGELRGQAQTLKEMQTDFSGMNRVLDQHEYEAFQEHALQSLEEGGLGWDTTAGADKEYYKTDPEARFARALNVTEKMKSDEDTGAKSNYAIIQSMYTVGEGEDAGDLVDRLTYQDVSGKEIEPSEEVIAAIQRLALQPNYDEFISNLNALPAEYGGDAIRSELMTNPNTSTIFGNLQSNFQAINTLDNELAGINELDSQTKLGQFVSDISGVSNQQALFGLFDQAVQGLNPEDHEQFFNAMELQTGSDLEKSYGEYKGFSSGLDNNLNNSLNQLAMTSMTGQELFPGQLETQYRGMEYEMAYTYPELSEGITKEENTRHQMRSVIGAQVGLDTEVFGNESKIVDAKSDKDGRIIVKVDPDADSLIGAHPPRWNYKGKPIYLDELNIVSLGRAEEAMPTAFEAGPIGYYWDPMSEEYRIKRNQ
tara:strand:- start:12567 stop:14189 length:1623 start_codon:yes stop_codon:yes gene_type:complete